MSSEAPPPLEELVPEALPVAKRRRFPFVWLVPLVALAIALSMVWRTWIDHGPRITLRFAAGNGVEAGKTQVKYRDVVVGRVEDVSFSDDFSEVIFEVQMEKGLDPLLTDQTRFWIVRPRIGLTGASGIDTLVSGVYVAMDPGQGGEPQRDFRGLDEPPNILSDARGTLFTLRAATLGSLSLGSPVHYRQVRVGKVTGYRLLPEQDQVEIKVFIDAPYDRLVERNSRFWNVSGISLRLGGEGVDFHMESLAALIAGGIAFERPPSLEAGGPPEPGQVFTLYPSHEASLEKAGHLSLLYVLRFNGNVRGLHEGAPVEFRGIRVGTVKEITLARDPVTEDFTVPVLIALEPERIPLAPSADHRPVRDPETMRRLLKKLVARGLRARLRPGSLLTGQLIVDFDFIANQPPGVIDESGPYPELPTASNQLDDMLAGASRLLERLQALPLEELADHLVAASRGLDRLLNDAALQQTPERLETALDGLETILAQLGRRIGPFLDQLDGLAAATRQTVEAVRITTSQQGALGSELNRTLRELGNAARAVRQVADYLERHPEALLRGKVR